MGKKITQNAQSGSAHTNKFTVEPRELNTDNKTAKSPRYTVRESHKRQRLMPGNDLAKVSQIESLSQKLNLDQLVNVIFRGDDSTQAAIKNSAHKNFNKKLPFIIGERKLEGEKYLYHFAHALIKPYLELRQYQSHPEAGWEIPEITEDTFSEDRFFLFANENETVVPLGRASDLEAKGLHYQEIVSLFTFPELDEVRDYQLIQMTRLQFSLLFAEHIIGEGSSSDGKDFSVMIPEPEKEERRYDMMASAAQTDRNPIFLHLLERGLDPDRVSILFQKSAAEMAKEAKAKQNLLFIQKFGKSSE